MEFKKNGSNYILRIDRGEEIVSKIKELCEKEKINMGTIMGIGATDDVEIGLFNTSNKKYYSNNLKGLFEITSLMGNITTKDNNVYLHIHINVADENNKAYGGHLNSCVVSATAEIVITVLDTIIDRRFDEEIGLNLLRFNDENRWF